MDKKAEDLCAKCAEDLARAKKAKAEADKTIKQCEKDLKDVFAAEDILTKTFQNGYTVEIQNVAGSMMVDTDKLKAAGLFDQYSKPKAGSVQVRISNPDDEFLCSLNERRAKHIEESKSGKA